MNAAASPWDEFFNPDGDNPLQLTEDEAEEFKTAVLDLNYEELYKPLFRSHEEFVRTTKRTYIILILLMATVIALDLIRLLWR